MTEQIEQILILEDQPVMREFLIKAAQGAFPDARVTEAATVAEARASISEQPYSLALLDISLPDGNGIVLVPLIRKQHPNCKLVMCTIFDDDEHVFAALRAGAQGYLLKEHPLEELIEQLGQIFSGRPPLSPLIASRILDYFHQALDEPVDRGVEPCHLTDREQEVLTLVAKGLTRNEVAQLLGIGAYTVADYIKSIYRKLDVSSRAEATLEALRMGLIEP
jgi:DNA-binding NarL/FixJ family response regulator